MIADLPPAPAAQVAMPGQYFSPARIAVLVGEAVTWRNADNTGHTVTAREQGLDSGPIPPGVDFQHRFDTAGTFRYACTIHRFMRGSVEVASLAFAGPDDPVGAGERVMLTGRGPAGTGPVTLERSGAPVATTEPGSDGAFAFTVTADGPATYRVRAGSLTSAALTVRVAAQVSAQMLDHGRAITVLARVSPDRPGARVVLEHYVRERFHWLPLRSRAWAGSARPIRFGLRTRRSPKLRVRVLPARGGWAEAISDGGRATAHRHG